MFIHALIKDFHDMTSSSGPGPLHCQGFTITVRHVTLGSIPLFQFQFI